MQPGAPERAKLAGGMAALSVLVAVVVAVGGFLAIALTRSSSTAVPATDTPGVPTSASPTENVSTPTREPSPNVTATPTETPAPATRTATPTTITTPTATATPTAVPSASYTPTAIATRTFTAAPTIAATATNTPSPPTVTPTTGAQFEVRGRAATAEGMGVAGVDVAFSKDGYRQDVTSGADGWFSVLLPSTGTYSFSGVGIICAANNWFSGGGCVGYSLFVNVRTSGYVTVPATAPVSLLYARVTVIVQGKAGSGTTQVFATEASGATGWSIDIASDGSFRIGLIPGIWTLQARTFSPSYSSGPPVTVTVTEGAPPPVVTLSGPP